MVTCPQCGGQNLPGMAYCENCGSPLPQSAGAAPPMASNATGAAPATAGAPAPGLITAEDPAAIAVPQPVMPADRPLPGPDIAMPSPSGANGVAAEPASAPATQYAQADTTAAPTMPGTADLPQLGERVPTQAPTRVAALTLTFPSGQTFAMQGDEVNVGRADAAQNWQPELDVIPYGGGAPDLGVSRHHARVMRQDSGFAVTDMGSTNGTYVNGRAAPYNQPVPLSNGDTLSFGALNTQVSIS